jgi:hypothetical protein
MADAAAFKGFLGVGVGGAGLADLRAAKLARTLFCRYYDLDFTENPNEVVDPTSGRSEPESVQLGNHDSRFKGTLEGTTSGPIPILARSALGGALTTTTVGVTGKQHKVVLGDTPGIDDRLSLERNFGTAADGDAQAINGIVSKLAYNAQQVDARWEVEGLGSSPARVATATSPTFPSVLAQMGQRFTTFTLDADATRPVRNFRWEIARQLTEDDFDVSSRQRRDATYKKLMATFRAEVVYQDMKDLRRFWGSVTATSPGDVEAYYGCTIKTERADVIAGGTAKHTVQFDAPKCFVKVEGIPLKAPDQVRLTLTGQAIYSPADSKAVDLTFINDVAGY